MKGKYPSVFEGVGKFPEPYKIKLKPEYGADLQTVRKIPLPYRDKIVKELDCMEALGVISKVNVPTEFVSLFVVREQTRLDCLDKSMMREHYYMKTREQILAELGSFFSHIFQNHI